MRAHPRSALPLSRLRSLLVALTFALAPASTIRAASEPAPTRADAIAALRKAVDFYRTKIAIHGSYGYRTAADLSTREGEQLFTSTQGWIESPGTAAVGLSYLETYQLTHEKFLLDAAVETGMALVKGQLRSGGWCEFIEFDPAKRKHFLYRVDAPLAPYTIKLAAQQPDAAGFLPHYRPFDNEMNGREVPPPNEPINVTTFDDDKSQGTLRFLMLLDRELKFTNAAIHGAVQYALEAFLTAQRPNGGWPQHFEDKIVPPQPADLKASFPESWSKQHAWTGFSRYYTINDDTLRDLIFTMLLAHEIYGEQRFFDAAKRGGDFLLLAQMPEPQPAWAQQYNFALQPVWARVFEPPGVSGSESQAVLFILIDLALATGDAHYLAPVPRALEYLRSSVLPDGRLARFYELRTNKPLFMTKKYEVTYDGSDVPTHYAFFIRSQLDAIARSYEDAKRTLAAGGRRKQAVDRREHFSAVNASASQVRTVMAALDPRGAWVENGTLRIDAKQKAAGKPLIESRTFMRNIHVLATYAAAAK